MSLSILTLLYKTYKYATRNSKKHIGPKLRLTVKKVVCAITLIISAFLLNCIDNWAVHSYFSYLLID